LNRNDGLEIKRDHTHRWHAPLAQNLGGGLNRTADETRCERHRRRNKRGLAQCLGRVGRLTCVLMHHQCGAVWGSVGQCGAVWGSVGQCGAVWDRVGRACVSFKRRLQRTLLPPHISTCVLLRMFWRLDKETIKLALAQRYHSALAIASSSSFL